MTLLLPIIAILVAAFALRKAANLNSRLSDQERRLTELRLSQADALQELEGRLDNATQMVNAMAEGRSVSPGQVEEGVLFDEISAEEAQQLLEKEGTVIVDVREPVEYAAGHIPGALWIPLGQIPERWEEIPRDAPDVIIHCAAGSRSAQACHYLSQEKGYTNLHNLEPGIKGWSGELETGMG